MKPEHLDYMTADGTLRDFCMAKGYLDRDRLDGVAIPVTQAEYDEIYRMTPPLARFVQSKTLDFVAGFFSPPLQFRVVEHP